MKSIADIKLSGGCRILNESSSLGFFHIAESLFTLKCMDCPFMEHMIK